MDTLNIQTERLFIRPLGLSDLIDFHTYRSNPEVVKFQGLDVMTIEQAEEFIIENASKPFGRAGEWVQFGIENRATKKLIGDCAIKLHADDTRIAEIGITISHREQQKGYGREVLLSLLSFLFDEKRIHRVVEITDADNTASIQLLKCTGFRLEGCFVENIFFKEKWGSEFQYAMLKREWDERKK